MNRMLLTAGAISVALAGPAFAAMLAVGATAPDFNLTAYKNGNPLCVRDVATLVDDAENMRLAAWADAMREPWERLHGVLTSMSAKLADDDVDVLHRISRVERRRLGNIAAAGAGGDGIVDIHEHHRPAPRRRNRAGQQRRGHRHDQIDVVARNGVALQPGQRRGTAIDQEVDFLAPQMKAAVETAAGAEGIAATDKSQLHQPVPLLGPVREGGVAGKFTPRDVETTPVP